MANIKLANFTGSQMQLIKRTYAKDCNNNEFDLFITACTNYGLDPFKKQIYAQVYNKDNADKRQLVIVVGIDGLRSIAARSHDYRPDDEEPVYTYDPALKSDINPLGILCCSVKAWKQDNNGVWHKANGTAYWDEFAPIKEKWVWNEEQRKKLPSGIYTLEGDNWKRMPRLMIAKVAEAQSLRKGWPNASGLYAEEEIHRMQAEELNASEVVQEMETRRRLESINASNALLMQWNAGEPLVPIAIGKVGDEVISRVKNFQSEAQLNAFESINRHSLKEYWVKDKNGALEVKKVLEAKRTELSVNG